MDFFSMVAKATRFWCFSESWYLLVRSACIFYRTKQNDKKLDKQGEDLRLALKEQGEDVLSCYRTARRPDGQGFR